MKQLVCLADPILRKKAKALSKEEILSPFIQELITQMVATMRAAPGAGLAAPQIGHSLQIAVIEDRFELHRQLTPEQLAERERREVPLHVIINPQIHLENEIAEFFEACLSIPELTAIVPRAKVVRVECLNEKGEPTTIDARGWFARILQHEIDHLMGILYLDRAKKETIMTKVDFIRLWKDKPITEVLQTLCQ